MIDLQAAARRELAERMSRGRRDIFIWGAGSAGRAAAAMLASHGVQSAGFIDRDGSKAGTRIEGLQVFLPEQIRTLEIRPRVLIASMYWREIGEQLRAMGYRPGRDVEVFADEAAVALGADGARRYAIWRHQWYESEGLGRQPSVPRVRIVHVSPQTTRQSVRRSLAAVSDGREWILLVDDRVRRAVWSWKASAIPDGAASSAPAAYDVAPPSRDRDKPFLLRTLADAATLSGPVLCRAALLLEYLTGTRRRGLSLEALDSWIAARSETPTAADPAGVCHVGSLRPLTGPATLRRPSVAAPALVRFALDTAEHGRPVFAPAEVAYLPRWAATALAPSSGIEYLNGARRRLDRIEIQVLSHSRGNFFFREIRDFLAAAWRRVGARVQVGNEQSHPAPAPCRRVIIAPHEFFVLDGRAPAWDSSRDLMLVNTEQPQTRWFAHCLRHLLESALVLDLNWQTALLLRTLGANAHFLPLGWDDSEPLGAPRRRLPATPPFLGMAPGERALPAPRAWHARPIDVLFVGTLSPRRARAFAAAAEALSRYRCYLHLPPSSEPLIASSQDSLQGRDMADLCRRSKVVLNIHRDDLPYCEWHRIMFQAMRHGALVVTEPMMPVPVFEPGRDFIAADLADLPRVLSRLLTPRSSSRIAARIAARGSATLRRHFPADEVARRTLELI